MASVSSWHHTNAFPLADCNGTLGGVLEMFEYMNKQRKELHRIAMIEFRLNKKHKRKEMQSEHRRLERTMKDLMASVRAAAARVSSGVISPSSKTTALRELVVTKEFLQKQNAALKEEIKRHEKFRTIVHEARMDPMEM
ncbi:uncharacterized protein IUM83_09547 [Phytophthora cinnamomi]|uniref:uncharacterized protein n=1 Tax=Phytophthora cinnamomi TaxID=4785 RepID=UPI0035595F66|nr:hypothetical protein IUM83_09547 [Phytophthora cinnamomi]